MSLGQPRMSLCGQPETGFESESERHVWLFATPWSVASRFLCPCDSLGKNTVLLFIVQSLSRVQLCDPMDCSTAGFHVLHYLLEFAQTHVLWVDDAIQPSHPLSSPSPPALNLSQSQGLFQWVSSVWFPNPWAGVNSSLGYCKSCILAPPVLPRFHKHLILCINSHFV